MATITYDVVREHEGDRFYRQGDTRDLDETAAKHLVPHVLRPQTEIAAAISEEDDSPSRQVGETGESEGAEKVEAAPANKAEGEAPHKKGRK